MAKAAGVGKGTIYGYFQTKREIFMAFCEEELDFALNAVATHNNPEAPLFDRLTTLFMSQFDFVTANREFGRINSAGNDVPRGRNRAKNTGVDRSLLGGSR